MKKLKTPKWLVDLLGLEQGIEPPYRVQRKPAHPHHLQTAMEELGVAEIQGPRHNPRIIQYFESTHLAPEWKADETPWCSAFVNWCMPPEHSTNSPLARSWMTVGSEEFDGALVGGGTREYSPPREGDLCVFFDRTSNYKGHVGFFISFNSKRNKVLVLGGNQNNSVCYQWYPISGKRLYLRSIRRI